MYMCPHMCPHCRVLYCTHHKRTGLALHHITACLTLNSLLHTVIENRLDLFLAQPLTVQSKTTVAKAISTSTGPRGFNNNTLSQHDRVQIGVLSLAPSVLLKPACSILSNKNDTLSATLQLLRISTNVDDDETTWMSDRSCYCRSSSSYCVQRKIMPNNN